MIALTDNSKPATRHNMYEKFIMCFNWVCSVGAYTDKTVIISSMSCATTKTQCMILYCMDSPNQQPNTKYDAVWQSIFYMNADRPYHVIVFRERQNHTQYHMLRLSFFHVCFFLSVVSVWLCVCACMFVMEPSEIIYQHIWKIATRNNKHLSARQQIINCDYRTSITYMACLGASSPLAMATDT